MKQLKIRNLASLFFIISVMLFGGKVYSQELKTDTVYHSVFGCDSLTLPANGVTYFEATTIQIPHYSTSHDVVYLDVLNIYNVEIGQSYDERDTVEASICSSNLPYSFNGHFFSEAGNFEIEFPTVNGCDSAFIYLKLNVMNGQRDTTYLSLCGDEQSIFYNGISFTNPGIFNFVAGNDSMGCPIVNTYVIERYPVVHDSLYVELCQSELPFVYEGQSFNTQGVYNVEYSTPQGCPGLTTLFLNVNPTTRYRETVNADVCISDLPYVFDNHEFYTSGTHHVQLENQYGCDSVLVTIVLNVVKPQIDTLEFSICESDLPFVYDSTTQFSQFGEYLIDINPDSACSHFELVKLSPYPTLRDTLSICTNEDSYIFMDSTFTESGIYTLTDTNAYQCVDYHTLVLTIKPVMKYDTVEVTICEDEVPYEFFGSKYYSSGSYSKILKSENGCDSARVRLQLSVQPRPQIVENKVVTRNDIPFVYRDTAISETGTYTFDVPAADNAGCDTLVILNLTVNQVFNVEKDTTVCKNDAVVFLGKTITKAGSYDFTYHLHGYDSVVTLNVNHFPTYVNETENISVGEYELPFAFGDSLYATAGYHEQTLKTVNGCDSVISMILTIKPAVINNDTIFKEICSNDLPYHIYDSVLTSAGTFRFLTHTESMEYDSVFFVNLSVKESPAIVIADTAYMCAGGAIQLTAQSTGSDYLWSNGEAQSSITVGLAGNYSVTVKNAFDCSTTASVVVKNVDLPEISVTGTEELCKGETTTLKVSGGSSYLWSDGSESDSLVVSPSETTTYMVTVTNIYGCSRIGNVVVVVNDLPTPEILGKSSICAGETTKFTAGGGVSYLWNTGAENESITVSESGVYSVVATDEHGCQNTASVSLVVNELPEIKILGKNTFCQGSTTIITASGGDTYEWNSGETSKSITVSYSGTYTVTGKDQNGCSASKSINVTQDQVNASISGNRYFCHGQSTTLSVSNTGNYTYMWFDGSTSGSIDISAPGQYSVTVTNANGCQNTLLATVSEYSMPSPVISGNFVICEGQSTTLKASGGIEYQWDDGSTQALLNVNTTGTYWVTVKNQYGCTATTSASVLVNQAPVVNILSADEVCSGESLVLTAVSSANTFNWASGQNTSTINVTPSYNTVYTVLVTDENNCTTTASKTITVNQPPVAYIDGNMTICSGDTAHLQAVGGEYYKWNTGAVTPKLNVSNPGIYSVVVTNNSGCSATATANVVVNSLPYANVTENAEICAGQSAVLTVDAPSGCSYTWSTNSHQSQISVKDAGDYYVTVTNMNNNCSSIYKSSVIVRDLPVVSVSGNTDVCQGQSSTLTASGAGAYQYVWSSGETGPFITASAAGNYTVTATNEYGCTASASRQIITHALPEPYISGNLSVCKGDGTTLQAFGGVTYQWNTSDYGNSVYVTPSTSKSYVVTATNEFGCSAMASATVVVNELPEIVFSGNSTICEGETADITASGAVNYVWSSGQQSATAHLSDEGLYYVTASNAYNCVSTDSIYIKVNPRPTVYIFGTDKICQNAFATLTASGADSYVWSTSETSQSVNVSPESTATYSVTGYDTNGCSFTANKVLIVEQLPEVSIVGNLTICQGKSTTLTAVGNSQYQWSNGSTESSIIVSPSQTMSYNVKAISDFGCISTATAIVNVNVVPTVIFNGNTSICEGETATITAMGGNSYQWSNGVTGNILTTNEAGTYTVTVTNSLNCQRSDSVSVNVWSNPTLSIAGESLICSGTASVLTVSGAQTYNWSTGENSGSITVMPSETETYTVIGYDEHGCGATAAKVVNVEALPNIFIAGDLSICHGESTVLTATGAENYVWSTGATGNSITVSEHGSYVLTGTSANGCISSTAVEVLDNPVPEIVLTGVETICENTTETLHVSGNYDYLWNTGSTQNEITIETGGLYSVVATNDYGCTSEAQINVATLSAPFIQIIGVNALCQGESTTLIASSNGQHFAWNTGDSTQTIEVVPENTEYKIVVTNDNGCFSEASHFVETLPTYNMTITGSVCEHQTFSQDGFEIPAIDTAGIYTFTQHLQTASGCDSVVNLLLTVNPLPRLDTISGPQNITSYGNSFYSVNNPEFVTNYEWRVSNTHWQLSNTDFPTVTMTVETNGSGVLTARGINSCGYTETSLSIYCNVGIEDHDSQAIVALYPNPVHQSLYINLENTSEIKHVSLYDNNGRLVYDSDCTDLTHEIDCSHFANGQYFVHFFDKNGNRKIVRKIVVNNR